MVSEYDTDPAVRESVDFALGVLKSCFSEPPPSTEETSDPVLDNSNFVQITNPYTVTETLSSELDPGVNLEQLEYRVAATAVTGPVVTVADPEKSAAQRKRERKAARGLTLGKGYFDFKPSEMTDELKRDLKIIRSRNLIGKGAFSNVSDYKKKLPTAVQMGTIVEGAADFYSSRVPKKQRKKTLVDELAEDFEFKKRMKTKYATIQGSKTRRPKNSDRKKKRR